MRIIITGTPGTGKTVLAKRIANERKIEYISLKKIIKEYQLAEGFDTKRRCEIVDEQKMVKKVLTLTKRKNCVIDGHLSHEIPPRFVNECIVTRCSLPILKKRLMKRSYSKQKIRENLDAEIFEVCLTEAKERGHKVEVVDTSNNDHGKK